MCHEHDRQSSDYLPTFIYLCIAENLKSHLQKFRIHRDRSKGEYASYYELSTRALDLGVGQKLGHALFTNRFFMVAACDTRAP